jgi:hypothetical protein
MDWKPEKPLTKEEEIAYSKKLLLGINKKSVGTKKKHKQAAISLKIDYFIKLSEMVILAIDFSTIEHKQSAIHAKSVLDKCMEYGKRLELMIMVDYQLDVTKLLTAMLPKESKYVKYIKGLEILVGRFQWFGDVMARHEERPEPHQNQ